MLLTSVCVPSWARREKRPTSKLVSPSELTGVAKPKTGPWPEAWANTASNVTAIADATRRQRIFLSFDKNTTAGRGEECVSDSQDGAIKDLGRGMRRRRNDRAEARKRERHRRIRGYCGQRI